MVLKPLVNNGITYQPQLVQALADQKKSKFHQPEGVVKLQLVFSS